MCLKRANAYIEQNKIAKEERPLFHVTAPIGWINDPNGFSFYNDKVHLFYQYHPYSDVWGPMHWGHVTTEDFIKWEEVEVALAPDESYDKKGCFSGTAIEVDGKHVLVYTGVSEEIHNGKKEERQNQCIAIGDGQKYKKIEMNPVITGEMLPNGFSKEHFRDPKIWREEDGFYLIAGNKNEKGLGQIVLFYSKDLTEWVYKGVLIENKGDLGSMWECPDFFQIDNKYILVVSPQDMMAKELEYHNGNNAVYTIGNYDKTSCSFEHGEMLSLDYGLDYYAPQTMELPDGRRILVGWLQSWDSNTKPIQQKWNGMMTLPRELSICDEKLIQRPVREIENYHAHTVRYEGQTIEGTMCLDGIKGRKIDLSVELEKGNYTYFTIEFAANETYRTSITYDATKEEISYDRTYSGIQRDVVCSRKMKVKVPKETLSLRLILDKNSAELFVNEGEAVMSATVYTPQEADEIRFICDKEATVHLVKHDIVMVTDAPYYQTSINLPTIHDVKEFVSSVSEFLEEIAILSDRYVIDAKSILGIFSLDLSKPLELRIEAQGQQLEKIKQSIQKFISEVH